MKVHADFILSHEEFRLMHHIESELDGVKISDRGGRSRIIRFGEDYVTDAVGDPIPDWILPPIASKCEIIHVTVNEYLKGNSIGLHTDNPKFGEIMILSLLAASKMRFVSPTGEVRDFDLPRRSLAVMSGELRNSWQHSTLPLEADRRISVVYRKGLK